MKNVTEAKDLAEFLIGLFPSFEKEWVELEQSYKKTAAQIGYDSGLSFHQVLQTFAPLSFELLQKATPKQVSDFCKFINQAISDRGNLENALSTCLLEHASQVGIRDILKPLLSVEARKEMR